jgi:proline iminopeptidase
MPLRPSITGCLAGAFASTLLLAGAPSAARAFQAPTVPAATVYRVAAGPTTLLVRSIGQGDAIIVLHDGPELDHGYLVPEMDRLATGYRLTYYDQRGRGRSADRVAPEDVTLASELDDLDGLRQRLGLERVALLGHGWGAVLAMEYALLRPSRVSHLILMNPAPASAADAARAREAHDATLGADLDRLREIAAGAAYRDGEPDSVAAYFRTLFAPGIVGAEQAQRLSSRMRGRFHIQGSAGILAARAIAQRLRAETVERPGYDLAARLHELPIPTLIVTGDRDFVPTAVAQRIASAIPRSTLVAVPDCGHFAYLECGDAVRRAIDPFLRRSIAIELPDLLRFDAVARDCIPVLDTLAFPGLKTPLWRYGVYEEGADTLRKESAAYWCSMSSGDSETAIVIWRRELIETPLPGGCSRVIRYRGRPGGLRFERRGSVPLRDAHPVDEPGRKGPPITARGTVIIAEHEDRTARFICHTGRWWVLLS